MRRVRSFKLVNDDGYSRISGLNRTSVEISITINSKGLMRSEVERLMAEASDETMKMMNGLRYVGGGVMHRIKIK